MIVNIVQIWKIFVNDLAFFLRIAVYNCDTYLKKTISCTNRLQPRKEIRGKERERERDNKNAHPQHPMLLRVTTFTMHAASAAGAARLPSSKPSIPEETDLGQGGE